MSGKQQETQLVEITVDEPTVDGYYFSVDCPFPVSKVTATIGSKRTIGDYGHKIIVSDLNPDYPGLIGTAFVDNVFDTFTDGSSYEILYKSPVDIRGSHYVHVLESDGSHIQGAFQGKLLINFKFES